MLARMKLPLALLSLTVALTLAAWAPGEHGRLRAATRNMANGSGLPHNSIEQVNDLLRRGGCLLCHRWERPWIGPSFEEIRARYGQAGDEDLHLLMKRLRTGSVGNHTPIPMGPCDTTRLNDEDLRHVLDTIIGRTMR